MGESRRETERDNGASQAEEEILSRIFRNIRRNNQEY